MQFHPNFIFRSPLESRGDQIHEDIFTEAIYLASPIFHNEIIKNINSIKENTSEHRKLRVSLQKYKLRSTTRCTPFGLFAGLSIGYWGTKNQLIFDSDLRKTLVRKTRLDMSVLCYLFQEISKLPSIITLLKYSPNNSMYLIGGSYRYVEYIYQGKRRVHQINRVDYTDYLEQLLYKSKNGLTKNELTKLLVDITEATAEEASKFVDELISSQILVSQLEPNITGKDYFDNLLDYLKIMSKESQNEILEKIVSTLTELECDLKIIDENIINSFDAYNNLHSKLQRIISNIESKNLVQVDLYKKAKECELNVEISSQIKKAITFLNKITPLTYNSAIEDFKKRFYERYEENEIPLLAALDSETGIGYPYRDLSGINPLVENLQQNIKERDRTLSWNNLQACLLKIIKDSIKSTSKVVEIDETNFKEIDFSNAVLPCTYSVMFNVLNSKSNKIELTSIGGSSATTLLGRFAGADKQLEGIIREIAHFEEEKHNGRILAEIVHLPESRTGNILARPAFREYEIPYLAKGSVDQVNIINMEDLVIKIRRNIVILWDKRLNKEIIPRLGNAHNYRNNSLPVYHFLCDLQNQYCTKSSLGFNWGVLMNQFSFLPRVEYNNMVLSPAIWKLTKIDLEALHKNNISHSEKITQFYDLKCRNAIPDKFLIADGDNEMLIDTTDITSIDVFLDIVKRRSEITLKEYLFNEDCPLLVNTNGNGYTNECIAIVFNSDFHIPWPQELDKSVSKTRQVFSIGSEWLYLKFYCGVKTADKILCESIKTITESLISDKLIDKWFFIRYSDTDMHIRFRAHLIDVTKYSEVLLLINTVFEPMVFGNIVFKIQSDTYKREINRYGDTSIELVETLFYYDSIYVVNCLRFINPNSDENLRWQIAIRSIDELLNDFSLSLESKLKLIEPLYAALFIEHGSGKDLKIKLDSKYRGIRSKVEFVLGENINEDENLLALVKLIRERSHSNKPIVQKLLDLNSSSLLQISLEALIGSLMHMNLDRLFMGRNRANEFVIYDILTRHYRSQIARQNKITII